MAEAGAGAPAGGTVVRAAGAVLWRPGPGDDGLEVALVHRPRYHDWSLPKGKLDPGEPALVAACREVREETGFSGAVGRSLGVSCYTVEQDGSHVTKTVRWWALRMQQGAFAASSEVDELRWLPPQEALALLTRPRDAEPLHRFLGGPAATRTLLLVRHGSAGSREDWSGDDDDRPLDATGRAQAQAVCRLLPLYGTSRLVSAPLERCTATLRCLADRLGMRLEPEPRLAAREAAEHPERTLQRVQDFVADGRTTAVCSQGEVLPFVVRALARRSSLRLEEVRAAKGSLWALSFDDTGQLVDADYTEELLA